MTRIKDLHKAWMKDTSYREQYDSLADAFAIAPEAAKGAQPRRPQPR